jgi:hypothetical protein
MGFPDWRTPFPCPPSLFFLFFNFPIFKIPARFALQAPLISFSLLISYPSIHLSNDIHLHTGPPPPSIVEGTGGGGGDTVTGDFGVVLGHQEDAGRTRDRVVEARGAVDARGRRDRVADVAVQPA